MTYLMNSVTRTKPSNPMIRCLPLPAFDANDLNTVRAAFKNAKPCALGQAWRAEAEPAFAPGEVRVGWRPDALLLFAELADRDIFTRATTLNERMWELGDTFEIFLRPADQPEYVEFHVTPNNQRLQLRFPSTEALRCAQAANEFDAFFLSGNMIESTTWVQPENQKWFVYAVIPPRAVGGLDRLNPQSRWRFSFSRYDYTRGGGDPVFSSTSPHAIPDFHRQQEWGELEFVTHNTA